jgi:hypothetical protein
MESVRYGFESGLLEHRYRVTTRSPSSSGTKRQKDGSSGTSSKSNNGNSSDYSASSGGNSSSCSSSTTKTCGYSSSMPWTSKHRTLGGRGVSSGGRDQWLE